MIRESDNDGLGGDAQWVYHPDGRIRESVDDVGARVCHYYSDETATGSAHTTVELAVVGAACPAAASGAGPGDRVTIETFDRADRLLNIAAGRVGRRRATPTGRSAGRDRVPARRDWRLVCDELQVRRRRQPDHDDPGVVGEHRGH